MVLRWRLILPLGLLVLCTQVRAGSWSTNYVAFRGGFYDGWDQSTTATAMGLGGCQIALSSGSEQLFEWSDAFGALQAMTLTVLEEGAPPSVIAGSKLQISVPSAWGCFFDTSVTRPVFGGNAAGKVNATVSYSGDSRTLIINVTGTFRDNNVLTIGGIKLLGLHLCSPGNEKLELDYTHSGTVDAYDEYFLRLRAIWPGGFYDGWDLDETAEPASVWRPRGTVLTF